MCESYIPCPVKPLLSPWSSLPGGWDAICLVDALVPATLASDFDACRAVDKVFDKEVSCFRSTGTNSAATFGARIVYAPIGVLDDFDDVRVYERAAGRAIARAIKAGARKPLLVLPAASGRFPHAAQSTLLGALQELYVPIQYREAVADKRQQVQTLGVWSLDDGRAAAAAWERAQQIERARFVARDIGGGDPERMAPPNVRFYLQQLFADRPNITIRVVDALADLERDYPLFAAVNRAAAAVPRHRGCIVFVEYTPPEAARKSLLLVGKGVTYDTGGADIKAGGVMAGMSRDKCGAAAVAGFMQLVAERQPKDVAVIGALCLVRNSVGEECYVSDEVIAARSGVRVRVGNTDAEGRMCMSDALYEMKQRALKMPDPHLFTVATLTGHAWLAVGVGYSIAMDNGPARAVGHAERLKRCGDAVGEPFEVSSIQREDFDAHAGKCLGEDALQANNLPSSKTPRGHQTPAAFIMMASGLTEHGTQSVHPLKFTHLDIAGSAGDVPHMPTGAPILALAEAHLD